MPEVTSVQMPENPKYSSALVRKCLKAVILLETLKIHKKLRQSRYTENSGFETWTLAS